MSDVHIEYGVLMNRFLNREISPEDFQQAYLARFKNEIREMDEPLFELLQEVFGDVDAFCADPKLLSDLLAKHPGFYLDEMALREKVGRAAKRLAELQHRK